MTTATRTRPQTDACTHHFLIEPPSGPVSQGRCRFCGDERDFRNSPVQRSMALLVSCRKCGFRGPFTKANFRNGPAGGMTAICWDCD